MKTIEELKKVEPLFLESFTSIEDLERYFCVEFPKEAILIVAGYWQEDYFGDAFVLYILNDKLYEVNGSHCSCYGLEGQWSPEETELVGLEYRVKNGNHVYDSVLKEILDI